MEFLARLLGWRKLLTITTSFRNDQEISVSVTEHLPPIASLEYTRLWLQYLANVYYVLHRVSPEWSRQLTESLGWAFEAGRGPERDALQGLRTLDPPHYKRGQKFNDRRIFAKYYVKGSVFRMIEPSFSVSGGPEWIFYSVFALLQYAIDRSSVNAENAVSLLTLKKCCELWPEAYWATPHESLAALPFRVYTEAAAQAYAASV